MAPELRVKFCEPAAERGFTIEQKPKVSARKFEIFIQAPLHFTEPTKWEF